MKKKGLIISTIVMVVVLVASLTTATYAWFTNTGSAKVDDIKFAVTSAADVLIGVSANNAYVAPDGNGKVNSALFRSDSTNWTGSAWTGSTNGLGLSINTRVNLDGMEKAVYSFTNISATNHKYHYFKEYSESATGRISGSTLGTQYPLATFDSSKYYEELTSDTGADVTAYKVSEDYVTADVDAYDTSTSTGNQNNNISTDLRAVGLSSINLSDPTKLLKAAGNGTSITDGTLQPAVVLTDYLNIAFGAAAAKADVMAYGCMVYIHPDDDKATLGLNASIHVAYNVNNEGWHEYDAYGTNDFTTVKEDFDSAPLLPTVTIGTKTVRLSRADGKEEEKGDAYVWIPLSTAINAQTPVAQDKIEQVQLMIYICGPDEDCVTSATGVSATISIEFLSINKATYEAAPAVD